MNFKGAVLRAAGIAGWSGRHSKNVIVMIDFSSLALVAVASDRFSVARTVIVLGAALALAALSSVRFFWIRSW